MLERASHAVVAVFALFARAPMAGLVALIAFLAAGCDRTVPPPLVEVTELGPRQVEPGERLEVRGAGFPQGRTGRVTLSGTIHRPGEPPSALETIELEGIVAAPDRLEVSVREPTAERFCGRGEKALHATFHGQVEVSFASTTAGAPPLVGRLRSATLDVLPADARASFVEARATEGARLLSYLGIVPGAPTPRGIPVEQIATGSPGERLGLEVGDVLTSVDGVTVLGPSDVVPASSRTAELGIRHGGTGAEETRTVSLVGYAGSRVPIEYAPALVIVAFALVVFFLLLLPGPVALVALELRIAGRLRRTSLRAVARALTGEGRALVVTILATAFASALALSPWLAGPELDGPALVAVGVSLLVWSRASAAKGALAAVRAAAQGGLAAFALVLALVLAVVQLGAFELVEIVRAQGGLPWQFAAARHPACAVLAFVYAGGLVTFLRTRASERPRSADLLERGGLLLLAALGVVAFFGGWKLPGLELRPGSGAALLSGIVFVVKTWALAALVACSADLAVPLSGRALFGVLLRRLVPGLALAGGFVFLGRRFAASGTLESAFALSLVALTVLFVGRIVARVHVAVSRPEPHASPFL